MWKLRCPWHERLCVSELGRPAHKRRGRLKCRRRWGRDGRRCRVPFGFEDEDDNEAEDDQQQQEYALALSCALLVSDVTYMS